MTEFQNLCVAFVRAAKGEVVADGIRGVAEPSGTNEQTLAQPGSSSANKPLTSGKKRPRLDANDENAETSLIKDSPNNKNQKKTADSWKKEFYGEIQTIEKQRLALEQKTNALKCYNLVLKNMSYEKNLGK